MLHVISWSPEYIMFCFATTCHFGFCCSFVRNKLCQILQEMAEPFCTLFVLHSFLTACWFETRLQEIPRHIINKQPADSLPATHEVAVHCSLLDPRYPLSWLVDAHSPLSPSLISESVKHSPILCICNQATPQLLCFAFSCSWALSCSNWEIQLSSFIYNWHRAWRMIAW